jgi:hypothetical protein
MVVYILGNRSGADNESRIGLLFRGRLAQSSARKRCWGSPSAEVARVRMLLRVKGLHQWIDPVLAAEIVAARTLQREGISVNQDLPDLDGSSQRALNGSASGSNGSSTAGAGHVAESPSTTWIDRFVRAKEGRHGLARTCLRPTHAHDICRRATHACGDDDAWWTIGPAAWQAEWTK